MVASQTILACRNYATLVAAGRGRGSVLQGAPEMPAIDLVATLARACGEAKPYPPNVFGVFETILREGTCLASPSASGEQLKHFIELTLKQKGCVGNDAAMRRWTNGFHQAFHRARKGFPHPQGKQVCTVFVRLFSALKDCLRAPSGKSRAAVALFDGAAAVAKKVI